MKKSNLLFQASQWPNVFLVFTVLKTLLIKPINIILVIQINNLACLQIRFPSCKFIVNLGIFRTVNLIKGFLSKEFPPENRIDQLEKVNFISVSKVKPFPWNELHTD